MTGATIGGQQRRRRRWRAAATAVRTAPRSAAGSGRSTRLLLLLVIVLIGIGLIAVAAASPAAAHALFGRRRPVRRRSTISSASCCWVAIGVPVMIARLDAAQGSGAALRARRRGLLLGAADRRAGDRPRGRTARAAGSTSARLPDPAVRVPEAVVRRHHRLAARRSASRTDRCRSIRSRRSCSA